VKRRSFLGLLAAISAGFKALVSSAAAEPAWEVWGINTMCRPHGHVSSALTNISVQYMETTESFVSRKVFPATGTDDGVMTWE